MSPEPLWKMWRIASMLVGLALHKSLIENEREFYFVNNPIGSMVLVYIHTNIGGILMVNVTIYGSTMDPSWECTIYFALPSLIFLMTLSSLSLKPAVLPEQFWAPKWDGDI